MVEITHDVVLNDLFHDPQVSDVAGFGVDLTLYTHLQLIVVAMVVGVAAGAKYPTVLLKRPGWIVEAVCCIEMDSSRHFDFGHGM